MPVTQNPRVETDLAKRPTADTVGTAITASRPVKAASPRRDRPFRRSQRVRLVTPLLIYGCGSDGQPFFTEAYTMAMSAHGALITLNATVHLEQELILINLKTQEEAECKVVFLRSTRGSRKEAGVEFLSPSPHFWRMAFPPDDWHEVERKRLKVQGA